MLNFGDYYRNDGVNVMDRGGQVGMKMEEEVYRGKQENKEEKNSKKSFFFKKKRGFTSF